MKAESGYRGRVNDRTAGRHGLRRAWWRRPQTACLAVATLSGFFVGLSMAEDRWLDAACLAAATAWLTMAGWADWG